LLLADATTKAGVELSALLFIFSLVLNPESLKSPGVISTPIPPKYPVFSFYSSIAYIYPKLLKF
jgi:hypothetical protein